MKTFLTTGFAILAQVASIWAADTPKKHLSGVFDKTVKDLSPYVLKLDGQTGTFHLRGDKLRNVEPGTRVWVSGQVRTELVRSAEQSPFPTQWHVYLDVTEVKRSEKAFERPDEGMAEDSPDWDQARRQLHLNSDDIAHLQNGL